MRLASLIITTAALILASCAEDHSAVPAAFALGGATMGTTYQVQVPDFNLDDEPALQSALDAELRVINDAMSTWQSDSVISRFNKSNSTEWFDVPANLAEVAQVALQIAAASDGAFDPTVGPLVKRWGFGEASVEAPLPPPREELLRLMARVGYQHLQVRADPPALRKALPELSIDLSAIAKGYAADRLAQIVAAHGYPDHLVEIGGELRVEGHRGADTPWHIGVEQPSADGTEVRASLALTGGGVASSGDYRNFLEIDGRSYSHLIDPRTGMPVDHTLAAVTVVANTAMHADGWATALMVLGGEQGEAIAARHSLAARFIEHEAGRFAVSASALYRQLPTTIPR